MGFEFEDQCVQLPGQRGGEGAAVCLAGTGRQVGGCGEFVDALGFERTGRALDVVGQEGQFVQPALACSQFVQEGGFFAVGDDGFAGDAADDAGLALELGVEVRPVDQPAGRTAAACAGTLARGGDDRR